MRKLLESLMDPGRVIRAFRYSIQGLRAAYQHESAFRQEILLAAVLVPLGVWMGHTTVERALLVGSVMLVLIVELVNSAIEAAVDRGGRAHHRLAARAKDMGSAAVLMALVLAAVVWGLVLWGPVST